jgi:GTP-binding protein Era
MTEALARVMPAFTDQLAGQLILRYSTTAATVALAPIPVAHVIPLTALQLALVIRLARLYGHDLSWRRSREVVPALAAGVGWRELFRQVARLVPVAGWALNGGIAFVGTYATGRAAQHLLRTGARPSPEELETYRREGKERLDEKGIFD